MSLLRRLVAAAVAALAVASGGCGAPARVAETTTASRVWPQPPDEARIRHQGSVTGPRDWGISRSWMARVADALSGRGEDRFVRPTAVAELDGILYVADPGALSLWVLDRPRGRHERITEVGGVALLSPVALALRADGSLFLADTGLKKVFLLDAAGELIRTIEAQGLERPAGLAWNEGKGELYVVDSLRHRVSVFDANGALLRQLGENGHGNGQFNHPTHIALDPTGSLIVTDALNFRIQTTSRDGRYLDQFGKVGDGAGDFSAPKGVAVDRAGHLHVVDARFDAVQVFDRHGGLLMAYGEHGDGPGQLSLPGGIFISSADQIFVADGLNRRVQIYANVGSPAPETSK